MSVEGNVFSMQSGVGDTQGLGSSGGGLDLASVYYFAPKMAAKLGFGFVGFDDSRQYSQAVVSNFGDRDTFTSSASATNIFGEFFYQSPFKHRSIFGYRAGVGYSFLFDAERSISNCRNCRVDNLSVESGLYLSARTFFYYSSKGKLGISARQYISDDINNGFVFWWEFLGRDWKLFC